MIIIRNGWRAFIFIAVMILIAGCNTAQKAGKLPSVVISHDNSDALVQRLAGDLPGSEPPAKHFSSALGMDFVYIPKGTFIMGSPYGELKRRGDEFQHQVTFTKGYYIQTTEVTQGQWVQIMGENPSYFDDCGERCPVENVTWNQVQHFIRKLNNLVGADVYRLPTESEWEYACRAGTKTPFAFGNCMTTDQANFSGMKMYGGCPEINWERGKTVPVASLQANPFGLYDMHGNVWEWCQDWHGTYPLQPVEDPAGPIAGQKRVYRGGGQNDPANLCRSAMRGSYPPGRKSGSLGFRLVIDSDAVSNTLISKQLPRTAFDGVPEVAVVALRTFPKSITNDLEVSTFLVQHQIFEHSRNPNGNFQNSFVDHNDGTITDRTTNLMWQISGSNRRLNFKRAHSFISDLNAKSYAGYSDWRLPTLEELASLLTKEEIGGLHLGEGFSHKLSSCWTVDKCEPNYPQYDGAWIINFSEGEINKAFWSKSNPNSGRYRTNADNYVKAVRTITKAY
jgi:formylglycine-generating enzyme required for sulfatase activity